MIRRMIRRRAVRRRTPEELAALIGAASLADPTGALTDRALLALLPIRRHARPGPGWAELDRELEQSARGILREHRRTR